ncbi:sorting nexin-29 isoform X1 [Harpegnathos saltator]|uniref:sorting nexin-29 isoform X1 n=2 Tax=Harpegnathos saltator TaxID=610380 RepID=UPI000DBED6EB|nr:sorting nexin-29 isoform X1 [Harpegnathos saltator]
MALRIMSAIVSSTHNVADNDHVTEKQKLLEDLLAAAKNCHVRFGGRAELATESEACIAQLCHIFELIFSHGIKTNCIEKINSAFRHVSDLVSGSNITPGNVAYVAFWPCIKEQLTWHEQERFSVLRKVHTDYGRGRAWLRAVLNEKSLERHLHAIIDPGALSPFYEEWAFLLDQEKSSVLPNVAAGLGTILFAIRIDNEELDDNLKGKGMDRSRGVQSEPVIPALVPGPPTSQHEKKKVPVHIISFDDDEERDERKETTSSMSAPATCLSSPTVTSTKDSASPCLDQVPEPQVDSNDNTVDSTKFPEWEQCESFEEEKILTPVTDAENLGGLVPVSPLDQTLDDMLVTLPNYLDDSSEVTEAAMEATEPLIGLDFHVDPENLDIDTLRVRLLAMTEVLEQAREDAITSRLQLARFQRQHQHYLERHELQLQTLNRENELLRQQLRKYVTAVQMLRRDSDSTTISEEDPSLDYHNEARQYEEKLIQVADMHAELMEFNARLTLQLTSRDRLVKMLQAELECLRGPLNEDDLPSEPPCLIHIWIPSAFLTGQPSDIHHVYQIYVRIRDTEWNIYRRYAQFYALYRELKKHDAIVATFEFPPKKTIGNKDAKFVEERRQKLQQWLRRIVGRMAQCSPAFSCRPSRQTLISLMPFFGDSPNAEESRKNNSARSTFSSSPQYMGL